MKFQKIGLFESICNGRNIKNFLSDIGVYFGCVGGSISINGWPEYLGVLGMK
jgi:hypothetical protein